MTLKWTEPDFRAALKDQNPVIMGRPFCSSFSTDSRKITPGDAYIALRGEKHDGNSFALPAQSNGASLLILEHQAFQNQLIHEEDLAVPYIKVEDGLKSLQSLASYHRSRLTAVVLGITGSNGKTSAKDMTASLAGSILGPQNVLATEGNLNNHIGLPLTILRAEDSHQLIVLEMGMNHAGEIELLSKIARPHHALITSIGPAHIEFFKDIYGIVQAKLEILAGLEENGVLLFPEHATGLDLAKEAAFRYKRKLMLFSPEDAACGIDGIQFRYHDTVIRNAHYYSAPMASNLLGALLLLENAGFQREDLIRYTSLVKPATARRFQIHKFAKRNTEGFLYLADDSYNANESSFLEALKALRTLLPEGRLALFAGEMGELGEEHGPAAHRSVGKLAGELGYVFLAACGGRNADLLADSFGSASFPDRIIVRSGSPKTLLEDLEKYFEIINKLDGILVKGSRSAAMDLISDAIIKKYKDTGNV